MNKTKFPYCYSFIKCHICGREFVVERILIGVDHDMHVIVTCKECLKKNPLPEGFVREHPDEAKAIEEWLKR